MHIYSVFASLGFPIWIRITHYINLLIIGLLMLLPIACAEGLYRYALSGVDVARPKSVIPPLVAEAAPHLGADLEHREVVGL